MKFLVAEVVTAARSRRGRRNFRVLFRFSLILAVLILVYSVVFHVLMQREGHEHTWITGFYWTLTVMSTLGFGDIEPVTDASFAEFVDTIEKMGIGDAVDIMQRTYNSYLAR